jgi:nucleotide-binding universal stress UspA family protein
VNLLCPVDLSEPSAEALRYAAALTSVVNGKLSILHVRPASPTRDAAGPADGNLDTFVSTVIGSDAAVEILERSGDPVTEILNAAVDVGSDVIVMGTHGRSGFQRLLLGSVAERVVRRSTVPVLTVSLRGKTGAQRPFSLATVLCAVDFSESSRRAVEFAASIAAAAGARLALAHALEWSEETETLPTSSLPSLPSSEDDAIAGMKRLLAEDMRERCAPEFVVGYGQPADELMRVASERHADLVVLGIRRRNPIDMAVFGSTAQRLIRDGACPVLTVSALAMR